MYILHAGQAAPLRCSLARGGRERRTRGGWRVSKLDSRSRESGRRLGEWRILSLEISVICGDTTAKVSSPQHFPLLLVSNVLLFLPLPLLLLVRLIHLGGRPPHKRIVIRVERVLESSPFSYIFSLPPLSLSLFVKYTLSRRISSKVKLMRKKGKEFR